MHVAIEAHYASQERIVRSLVALLGIEPLPAETLKQRVRDAYGANASLELQDLYLPFDQSQGVSLRVVRYDRERAGVRPVATSIRWTVA